MINYKQLRHEYYNVRKQQRSGGILAFCLLLAFILILLACCGRMAYSAPLVVGNGAESAFSVNIAKIAEIESSNNPKAYNKRSGAVGLCQITKPALIEYNNRWLTNWSMPDLYNADLNLMVGEWYINERIPAMLKAYRIKDTLQNRIFCYNWGIGNLIKWIKKGSLYAKIPRESKEYYRKYTQMQGM